MNESRPWRIADRFCPPEVTAAEAVLARRLARRSDPFHLPVDSGELVLRCDPAATIQAADGGTPAIAMLEFEVQLAAGPLGIGVPAALAVRLLERAGVSGIDPASALGALALNVALDPALSWLEHQTGEHGLSVVLPDRQSRPGAVRGVVCLRAECDGDHFPIRFVLPAALWEACLGRLESAAYSGPDLDCPVEIAIEQAALRLPYRLFETLRPGDVVLPDDPPIGSAGAQATIGGCLRVDVALQAGQATVLSAPVARRASDEKRNVSMHDPDSPPDAGPGDIEIRLAFEVGRQTLPYSAVNRLAPGYVFDLAREPGTAVDIVANGARIGAGEIVAIGDLVGVRVTRMFGHE